MNTWLHGKIDSYLANAYEDAAIAEHLISSLNKDRTSGSSHAARRARALIRKTPHDTEHERIAVQAFTQYWINGYVNFFYARLLGLLIGRRSFPEPNPYAQESFGIIRFWYPWLPILLGDQRMIHEYVYTHADIRLTLTPMQIVEEIIRVQHANRKVNYQMRDLLLSDKKTPITKITQLRKLSEDYSNSSAYLRSAADTQAAASRWDQLWIRLLTLRYGN